MCLNKIAGMGGSSRQRIRRCDQSLTAFTGESDDEVVLIQCSITFFRTHRPASSLIVRPDYFCPDTKKPLPSPGDNAAIFERPRVAGPLPGKKRNTCCRPGRATAFFIWMM